MAELRPAGQQFSTTQRVATRIASCGAKLRAVWRDGQGATLPVLGLTALILFLRRRNAFLNPQLWAEDGKVFFLEQWERGSQALITPYAGYLCSARESLPGSPMRWSASPTFRCFITWRHLPARCSLPGSCCAVG